MNHIFITGYVDSDITIHQRTYDYHNAQFTLRLNNGERISIRTWRACADAIKLYSYPNSVIAICGRLLNDKERLSVIVEHYEIIPKKQSREIKPQ